MKRRESAVAARARTRRERTLRAGIGGIAGRCRSHGQPPPARCRVRTSRSASAWYLELETAGSAALLAHARYRDVWNVPLPDLRLDESLGTLPLIVAEGGANVVATSHRRTPPHRPGPPRGTTELRIFGDHAERADLARRADECPWLERAPGGGMRRPLRGRELPARPSRRCACRARRRRRHPRLDAINFVSYWHWYPRSREAFRGRSALLRSISDSPPPTSASSHRVRAAGPQRRHQHRTARPPRSRGAPMTTDARGWIGRRARRLARGRHSAFNEHRAASSGTALDRERAMRGRSTAATSSIATRKLRICDDARRIPIMLETKSRAAARQTEIAAALPFDASTA